MTKFLVDENIPPAVAHFLRSKGFGVKEAKEDGVIRIRVHPPLLSDIIQALDHFLQKFDLATIRGTLIVLAREGFRVRKIS